VTGKQFTMSIRTMIRNFDHQARHPRWPSCTFLIRGVATVVILALANSASYVQAATPIPGEPQSGPIAIVGATVHPMVGEAVEGGTVLFLDGKLTAIGKDVELPEDVERIDATGKHVYPGLFCAGGELGLVEIDSIRATIDVRETGSLNPNVKAQVAVNPESELIPVTRANGVLLALSNPQGGLVSGMSVVLQLDGWTWEDMTVRSPAAMHVQWPQMRASQDWWTEQTAAQQTADRDNQLPQLQELFQQAQFYRQAQRPEVVDVRYEALLPVLAGEVPLLVSADTLGQIQAAVALAAQYKLKLIINGGYDAESCAALLREHDVPVIVPAVYRLPRRRSDPYDAAYSLPSRLHRAGVRFCIAGVDRFGASNLRNLPYHAGTAVAYGLPADEALKAITLYPAQILGVDDRLGSLETGKEATLIVTTGNPLETATQVELAFIAGRRVDLASRHTELWWKYEEKYRRMRERGELEALSTGE
jgi:imidazolonepropionase-like amidohydrolase